MSVVSSAKRWVRSRSALPRDVLVLGMISFCVAVGFGVVVPVLPVFARSFGVNNFAVGAVISSFALLRLATSPFVGRLINRFSERTILAIGIFIVAVSSGLVGFAESYPQLLALRAAGGIGSAMFSVSALTLLLNSVPFNLRGRASGVFQGGFLLGGMAGPAIGGLLAAISLTAPFFFYALTLSAAGTVGLMLLHRPDRSGATAKPEPPVPFSVVARDPRFQAACLTNFAQGWSSMGVRSALVPVLVVEVLHRTASWTGIAFAVAAVAQTIALAPAGRFVDTIGRRPAMIAGGALAAVAIAIVPFAPNIWLLMVVLCLYGVAAAMLGTAPAAAVGDAAGGRSGTPVAVFSMFSDVGAILGPLAAGFLADQVSYPVAFGVGAAILVLGSVVSIRMPRSTNPAEPAPPPTTEEERR
ncbi:MAG: MFS transporter [Propionibacteriaceae bacterium]